MEAWLTEEQSMLHESAARYLEKEYTLAHRRDLVAGDEGYGSEHWRHFAESGWLAAPLPEAHGGLGGSLVDVAVLCECFGQALVVEPYLSTVVLGAGAVVAGGGEVLCAELLPGVAAGERKMALAFSEPQSRYNLADVEVKGESDGGGFRVSGRKSVVLGGDSADQIVVSMRTGGDSRDASGITLGVVDANADGVAIRPYRTVDGLRAADITFSGAQVPAGRVVGQVDNGLPLLEQVVDHGIAAVCAEAAGIMGVLVTSTRDYLMMREQFGRKLASFQVLQHRVVDMFVAHELSRSLTYRSAKTMAADAVTPDSRARAASAAKVQIGKAGRLVGQDAVQLHGGMGMTEELHVGHHFKRLTMIGKLFGDAEFHRRRMAQAG